MVVQITSSTVGIIGEMTRQRISLQAAVCECDRLQQALAGNPHHKQELVIKSGRKNVVISFSDILYMESKNNYVYLNLTDGQQLKTSATLSNLLVQLPADEFVRIHKSFVVARSHVSRFNSRQVSIANTILPIGRTYADAVRTIFHMSD